MARNRAGCDARFAVITVRRASALGESCRSRLSEVFVEGFGEDLRAFSKDSGVLARALEHMFVLDAFFVALVDSEVAGIAACTNADVQAIRHERKALINHLGFIRGTVAAIVFRQYFQKPPEKFGEHVATVGFVATASAYRGRGVATVLLNYVHETSPYDEFILEASDNNFPALELYERLGYREFKRIRQRHPKLSGFDYTVHLQYLKAGKDKDPIARE